MPSLARHVEQVHLLGFWWSAVLLFLLAFRRNLSMPDNNSPQSNTLGKASLVLGILGASCVFSVGLCAGVGQQQGWLKHVGGLLFILGGTSAFLGLLGILLGFVGLFGANRARVTAIVGLVLGVITLLLFIAIVNSAK